MDTLASKSQISVINDEQVHKNSGNAQTSSSETNWSFIFSTCVHPAQGHQVGFFYFGRNEIT